MGKQLLFKEDSEKYNWNSNKNSSIAYLAPEMLKRRGHGKGVDWYLFGVVMYEMLTGNPPYYANTK